MAEFLIDKLWNDRPSRKNHSRFFVGRKTELQVLQNTIKNSESGAILVAGERGVGKTDLVNKALSGIKASREKELVKVYVNASHIIACRNDAEISPLVELMIKSLYSTINNTTDTNVDISINELKKDEKVMDKMNRLYIKSSSIEYLEEFEDQVEKKAQNEIAHTEAKTTETTNTFSSDIKVNISRLIEAILRSYLSFLLLPTVYLLSIYEGKTGVHWNNLITLIPTFFTALKFGELRYQYKQITAKKDAEFKTDNNSKATSIVATVVASRDKSRSVIENDFIDLIDQISTKNIKLIFILDELDKATVNDGGEILQEISRLKFLLNHTDLLTILITDSDVYQTIENQRKENPPGLSSTLFIRRILIPPVRPTDIRSYLDQINKESPDDNKAEWDDFCNYLLFDSQSSFFTLPDMLINHIGEERGEHFVIRWIPKNEDLIKANKQRIITLLLENRYLYSYTLSERSENIHLIRKIYEEAEKLSFNISDIEPGNEPRNREYLTGLLLIDYGNKASACEIYTSTEEVVDGLTKHNYVSSGKIGTKITSLNEILGYEQALIDCLEEFRGILRTRLHLASKTTGLELSSLIDTDKPLLGILTGQSGDSYQNAIRVGEEIQEAKKKIKGENPYSQQEVLEIVKQIKDLDEQIIIIKPIAILNNQLRNMGIDSKLVADEDGVLKKSTPILFNLLINTNQQAIEVSSSDQIHFVIVDGSDTSISGNGEVLCELRNQDQVRLYELQNHKVENPVKSKNYTLIALDSAGFKRTGLVKYIKQHQ